MDSKPIFIKCSSKQKALAILKFYCPYYQRIEDNSEIFKKYLLHNEIGQYCKIWVLKTLVSKVICQYLDC